MQPIRVASCLFAATLQLLSAVTGSQSNYLQSVAARGCHKQEESKNSFFILEGEKYPIYASGYLQ